MGRLVEPLFAPLGYDWQLSIGVLSSFAAREVFNSTMSTVYNVGAGDSEADTKALAETLKDQTYPDGSPIYTTLTGVTLMVFYVFAMQCVSTVELSSINSPPNFAISRCDSMSSSWIAFASSIRIC